jgi:hypothetical protein
VKTNPPTSASHTQRILNRSDFVPGSMVVLKLTFLSKGSKYQ